TENCCRLFVSRTLDNKERDSYGFMKHTEKGAIMDNRKVPEINQQPG
ncbi:unnamed protein product, partial [marine sediment metagenome]